jgi:hypothetical protein
MNVRWCALSGKGCSGGGVSNVVSAATHDDRPGCTRLMAVPVQRACGAGVANLNLVTVHPAVPDLFPSRFGVAPVRGVDTGVRQGGKSSWCRRGWDAGRAHLCNGELDVGNGFGECGIGGDQVFDGDILLNVAFARLSREEAICCAWLSSAA